MSMLPDGAETQLDDWTVFFLNQTPFNTISPVLALDSPELRSTGLPGEEANPAGKPDLLCVLNLVRTKHDKTLDRGARVLALAICTRHPFIQIFKPVLLMALDDYLTNPSQDCLARLFDAVNSMDFSGAPILTRHEKMVMRLSERKDIFAEKFNHLPHQHGRPVSWNNAAHRSTQSMESQTTFEEGLLGRQRNDSESRTSTKVGGDYWDGLSQTTSRDRADTESSVASSSTNPPSESSFTLGGSAVWVGDESGLELAQAGVVDTGDSSSLASASGTTTVGSTRKRRSTDGSSGSSLQLNPRAQNNKGTSSHDVHLRTGLAKDTHFFHTTVDYKDYKLPIKMPLSTFAEEVGDYSLITLVKVFSSHQLVSGPQHPHLHTSGPQTHPIIILFNALVTGKRVIFLGHRRPAGEVSIFVLAACALASGCGAVLRGFVERAFPYANLNNREEWESVPAYIAGVTNPIFETSRLWDLLLDIGSGTVTVSKDIHTAHPVTGTGFIAPLILRSGTLKAESSVSNEDELRSKEPNKADFVVKPDNTTDNLFIEDIKSAIDYHYGESLVRVRFTEYVTRFVRLASRYEEEVTGSTKIGHPNVPFAEASPSRKATLGSGLLFTDEQAGMKELAANAHRIEAWRKTNSYHYCTTDFAKAQSTSPIRGFDVVHQIFRLRHAKLMSDAEAYLIMRTLADNVKTYDQVVELLSYLMPHSGGLLPLGFGLFHHKESIREATVDLFNHLRQFPVGVLFLQTLNHFQRYAYVRQAHARDKQLPQATHYPQPAAFAPIITRAHSSSSAAMSVAGGYFGERTNGAL
ncbi:spindle pole body interacting protein [Moniliophthora roreri]|nr:spindle pole body interacting protein [Moniliophthora roreri]